VNIRSVARRALPAQIRRWISTIINTGYLGARSLVSWHVRHLSIVRASTAKVVASIKKRATRDAETSSVESDVAAAAIEPGPAHVPMEAPNLGYRQALVLIDRVPELREFSLKITPGNASAVLAFFHAYIPLVREEARGAHIRSLLTRLKGQAPDLAYSTRRAVARLDLTDGAVDRSGVLLDDPVFREKVQTEWHELNKAYGAALVGLPWPNASRGASLLYYLQKHSALVSGKDVLHVAPEPEPRQWLAEVSHNYVVLDGRPGEAIDVVADITAIPLPQSSFDIILCHRVLEHVLDDMGAMHEFHRVLRPGGVLNLSVPQAVHRERTAEWIVPDESHDSHVRHYGRDLTARLESVGFTVIPITWLCAQDRNDLISRCAYPMRMYEATKPIQSRES
jgi:SAM-dependent methyltransferase